ncbi:MBL fold metallo-hydrolase [Fulvivirgaceae bacterium BMA12]|uniref:MBL fold metallo-hydrolase n=1 Tax=Agaribacillus aureus TaxID=3051825 RepID=A0ABT8LKA0_9BACT|nr:MBL fold metallo-hydrolase [Fulvivirgaceae bacterium BMA12]
MKVEQIYTGCLAEAAYYIESDGEAAIIDPLRETAPYIERAMEDGAKIKYVLETHFHADFVSGHLDLARKTGAKIVYGPTARPNFDAYIASDEEILSLGKVKIKVLHTPGHTMESSTFLLIDENGKNQALFTGDTLFIGDVGRPDLAVKTDLSMEDLATHLYDSLRNKIMPLEDDLIVYPGHGAGSACGKMMSSETTDTLGNQKKFNYALRPDMSCEEFVEEVTSGLAAPPQYFPKNAVLNKMGYESLDDVLKQGVVALEVDEFEEMANRNQALILDTRSKEVFPKGFIPGSVFIGIDESFAPWVGALITDLNHPILFLADEGREEEVVTRLARVGYDNTLGYLKGGFEAWKKAGRTTDTIPQLSAADFAKLFKKDEGIHVLDVRKNSEYNAEHIKGISNFPLDFINKNMAKLDKKKHYFVHCAGGYRSMIMASILRSRGFGQLLDIQGGYKALVKTDLPRTEYHEPTTML